MTTLVPVNAVENPGFTAFCDLPAQVYRDDPRWAPESEDVVAERFHDATSGPVALEGVVALRAGRPLARAAAIIEPAATDEDGRPEGWIGMFECLPDAVAAGVAVLEDRRRWLITRGVQSIGAPRTDGLRGGLIVSGFDQPQVVLTPHNPPYYPELLLAAGFTEEVRMVSYVFTRDRVPSFPSLPTAALHVRSAEVSRWSDEVTRLHAIQEAVFRSGPGHLRRAPDATRLMAERLLPSVDPDLVLFAEDRHGTTIGALICLPDVWQRRRPNTRPDRARLVSIGVLPGWRGRGAAIAMGATLTKSLLAKGYQTLEGSWVRETNSAPRTLARVLGAEPGRVAALYRWRADANR